VSRSAQNGGSDGTSFVMSLMSLERGDEARQEFERSIALQPAQTETYFHLGVLQPDAKQLKAAEGNLRHVLERDPNHAGALAALGRLELEVKEYDAAAVLLERLLRVMIHSARPLLHRSHLCPHGAQGRFPKTTADRHTP
jgi:Tfp pilus assembly protein PilF